MNGNAGAGSTYDKNIAAFKRYSIVPRRLVPSKKDKDGNKLFADTTTTVLGQKLLFPIAIAPVGVQRIFNREGEPATARAAVSVGVPYILSTAASTSIEDVADAHDLGYQATRETHQPPAAPIPEPVRWFQLYWPPRSHDDITISMLDRAKAAGYTALFVTLDTYVIGWRPSDMTNGYNPFLRADRIGVEIGFTDPRFRAHFKEVHGYEIDDAKENRQGVDVEGGSLGDAAKEWASIVFPGHSKSWEDVKFLQAHWDGPIVLKGIQSVADAQKAVEIGCQGIVVSNHGGRQQDGGNSSLGVLKRIADAVGDKIDVLFDSGIRNGADIMKAVALGAKCCLIGRPYVWGLTIGGEDGVRHVLRSLAGEVVMNMHLAGCNQLQDLKDMIVKEDELF